MNFRKAFFNFFNPFTSFKVIKKNVVLFILMLITITAAYSQEKVKAHDPVMIQQDGTFYLFTTGRGISVWSSTDMNSWKQEAPVFENPPQWAVDAIPGFKGHIWAPDIAYHNELYHLYYSVSAFGKNTSAIGLAVNKTLDPKSPDFEWVDKGKVIQSIPGRDLWNAIDPNLIFDDNGIPWLSFGSFWSGMKLVKLNSNLDEVAEPQEWYTIASRERNWKTEDEKAGEAAIEAPFIFKKGPYYYLFVSFDYCCRGVNSTYKIVIGRSDSVKGPYIDKSGVKMTHGGGTLLLEGDKHWYGAGHNSAYTFDGTDYLIYHAYDASDEGKSKLRINKLDWDKEGWPVIAEEIEAFVKE